MRKYTSEWWQELRPERVGDECEKLFEKTLDEFNRGINFAWHRLPDAKAGRGRIAAQPGDYIYQSGAYSGFIELKALKHPYRLPAARLTQLPVLNKWETAGATNFVVIFHYLENVWRIVSPTELTVGVPSWNLACNTTYASARDALLSTGVFK